MEIFLWMGIVIGLGLYISKIAFIYLILPKTWIKKMHGSPLAGAVLDIVTSYMAIHIALLAGGSLVAMIAMVTFGFCSMVYIYGGLQVTKFDNWRAKKKFMAKCGY